MLKFFLLINVKMPTIVGILTFMSRKNRILGLSESEDFFAKMSQGRKNRGQTGTRTQCLSLTVRALCQLSYRATWSSYDISPCLIRFVLESARNNGGTTRHILSDTRCPSREPTLSHQMSQGRKNRGPTGTRTHQPTDTELLGRPLTLNRH